MAKNKIIQPFLYLEKDKYTVDTVAELQTRQEFIVGDVVTLLGYYKAGDGAGHQRVLSNTDDGSGIAVGDKFWNLLTNGEIRLSWFGIKSDPASSVANSMLFQKALDYKFEKLVVDKSCFLSKQIGKDYCIKLNKNKDLVGLGARACEIKGWDVGDYDILQLELTDNGGYGDIRNWRMENVSIWFGKDGRHGVEQVGGLAMLNCMINNCSLGGGTNGYGFHATECKFAHSTFSNNTISDIFMKKCLDANKFINNNINRNKNKAITLDLLYGCYNTVITNNTLTSRDGAIHIINGSEILIQNNQIESFKAHGMNQSTDKSHIFIEGRDYSSMMNKIIDNNLGGGTNLDYLITLGNVIDTFIDKNRWNAPAIADMNILPQARYTRIYPTNQSFGNISNPRPNKPFPSNMVIKNSGYGTMGCDLADKIVLLGDWQVGTVFIDPYSEKLTFRQGFFGGLTATQRTIGTLQEYMLPALNYKLGEWLPFTYSKYINDTLVNEYILINTTSGQVKITSNYSNVGIGNGIEFRTAKSKE